MWKMFDEEFDCGQFDCEGPPVFSIPPPPRPPFLQELPSDIECSEEAVHDYETCSALPVSVSSSTKRLRRRGSQPNVHKFNDKISRRMPNHGREHSHQNQSTDLISFEIFFFLGRHSIGRPSIMPPGTVAEIISKGIYLNFWKTEIEKKATEQRKKN